MDYHFKLEPGLSNEPINVISFLTKKNRQTTKILISVRFNGVNTLMITSTTRTTRMKIKNNVFSPQRVQKCIRKNGISIKVCVIASIINFLFTTRSGLAPHIEISRPTLYHQQQVQQQQQFIDPSSVYADDTQNNHHQHQLSLVTSQPHHQQGSLSHTSSPKC